MCFQDLLDAFFFGIRATKKKALQKRNGVFCAHAARAPTFEKVGQNNRLVCANIVRDKSKFEIMSPITNLLFDLYYYDRDIVVWNIGFGFGAANDFVGNFIWRFVGDIGLAEQGIEIGTIVATPRCAVAYHHDKVTVLAFDIELL